MTGPRQGYRLQKTPFCILGGIYCHNIPTHTPDSGWHGVTEVAKTANIAKMAEKCISCIGARSTPPHTNLWSWDPETLFRLKIEKNQKIRDCRRKKRGGHFFSTFLPPPAHPLPPPPPSKTVKKVGFKWGGSGGVWTKNSLGDAFIGQNNDFTRG